MSLRPCAISPLVGCDMELGLIQQTLPHDSFDFSETKCLNLNIAVPEEHAGKLPVFVFLHGGGFSIGGNSWPQYDLTSFVRLANESGQPAIGITIKCVWRLRCPELS